MNIKTEDLIGISLDWAVATCEGATDFRYDTVATYWMTLNGKDIALQKGWAQSFTPSTDWRQGGPIIERHIFRLEDYGGDGWQAEGLGGIRYWGPTPLIAAMRVYVASRLGDEVDVPDSLVSKGSGTDQEAA